MDAAAYAVLAHADRSILAWEWLRRDPAYRTAAFAGSPPAPWSAGLSCEEDPLAGAWGLHAFADPDLPAPSARPLWRAEAHPWVLRAATRPAGCPRDSFDLERFRDRATLVHGREGAEHWLFSDGLRTIRLDLAGGTLLGGAVRLEYALGGIASAARPLMTLRRLLALCRRGAFAHSLHGPETRTRRWILQLRAWDGLRQGATQREIAAVLLGSRAMEPGWRTSAPSLRSQAQRLVRSARAMADGGYRTLPG